MEIEDEMFLEDDEDILDIIEYGFPKRRFERTNFFQDMDQMSFFRRFRLTKLSVLRVLERIEEYLEFDNDINNSVSPVNQLLTTLRIYTSAGHQTAVGDLIGIHQSTVSRIVAHVSAQIARLRPEVIKMRSAEQIIINHTRFYRISRFPRVGGCIDGTHIRIQSPGSEDAEVFRNRKGYFFINTQVVSDADLKISDIVARWSGSAHDSTVFNNSRIRGRFEAGEFENNILLGDSVYTLRPYLLTPVNNPRSREELLYNEAHIRTRNSIERLFGIWKRRFQILAYDMRCKLSNIFPIIVATAVLHNIAQDMKEEIPLHPENIGLDELNYLIDEGQIPDAPIAEPLHNARVFNNAYTHREHIITNFFARL